MVRSVINTPLPVGSRLQGVGIVGPLLRLCVSLPWEHVLFKEKPGPAKSSGEPMVRMGPAALPAPVIPPVDREEPVDDSGSAVTSAGKSPMGKPGCTAADEAIVALGHLQGLARGNGGFGVLRVSKERLEVGAEAAEHLGKRSLAKEMQAIGAEMPNVHTAEDALALAERLEPVVDQAWDLGRHCKGSLNAKDLTKMRELAQRIRDARNLEQD